MDKIIKKQNFKLGTLSNLLSYSIPIAVLLVTLFFFNNVYNELLNYSDQTTHTEKIYGIFRTLGVQVNKVAVGDSKIYEGSSGINSSSSSDTQSQLILNKLELLNATVKDTVNIKIAQKLDKTIRSELIWLTQRNASNPISLNGTSSQFAALQNINSLIDSGIERTSFLLDYKRKEFKKSILSLLVWIIVFFILSIIFLIYTNYHFYKEREKTRIKEIELRRSEKQFRTLLEKSADIIAVFNKNMSPIYQSPSTQGILGYSIEEGKKAIEMDDVHPEDIKALEKAVSQVNTEPGRVVDVQFRVVHKSGQYLWLEGTLVNLFHDPEVGGILANLRDITVRKKTEDDLMISMKEISDYKYALDESSIVAITDQKGVIKHINDNFCIISGYTREELIGQDHRIINSGFHSKEFIRDLWRTIASGQIWKGELKNKTKGGTYYWVDTTIVPFLNSEGKPYQYVAIRSDITLRKQTEEELFRKTVQIRDILERIEEGFIVLDRQFRYTYANKQIGKMIGREPDSLIGKYVWDEFPEAIGSATYKAFERAFKEQVYVCEVDYYPPLDLWQENHIYPSADGIVVFIRDISQQKRHEQEINSAYQRLAFHFTNTPMGVIEWETDGKLIQWSEQAETIFGWKASEVVGRNISELKLSLPERAEIDEQLTMKLISGELDRLVGSTKNRTKDGNIIYTEWYNSVLKSDEGKVISIVSFANDITDRKMAEEMIISFNAELENKVNARTEQLVQANKDLEAFSYSVSHDLRAPLRAVNGFSTMLLEIYKDKLDERAERIISTIVSSTVNMGMLIDDLLKFSRLGRKVLNIQPVNMDALVRDCVQELWISNPGLNTTVEIEILPKCLGDHQLLRQVWMNLIGNALKYSSKADSPSISVSFKESKQEVTYIVQDNGVGFDMQYVDKLFGVFQRLHRQSEFEGTGIGLAIVKRIIDKHEGKVWAESEMGKGASFYFTLLKK